MFNDTGPTSWLALSKLLGTRVPANASLAAGLDATLSSSFEVRAVNSQHWGHHVRQWAHGPWGQVLTLALDSADETHSPAAMTQPARTMSQL